MSQVPSDGVTLSHRMESLSVPGPAGPWWLASRTLPPAPLSLTKLQSHRLPPCPGEHPPSASLLPAHRNVSFWTGLSPASLYLLTQVYAEKAPPLQGSLPWSPCLKHSLSCHSLSSAFTWIVHFIYRRWALIHTACLIVQLCPLLPCGSLGVSCPRL